MARPKVVPLHLSPAGHLSDVSCETADPGKSALWTITMRHPHLLTAADVGHQAFSIPLRRRAARRTAACVACPSDCLRAEQHG
jgi:hypothetical protein